jgi:hypothetical protein
MTRRSKRTPVPKGTPPSLEEFRNRARQEFAFLQQEFGFSEEPIPSVEQPYLNPYAVWFKSPSTRVVVEGLDYGMSARVALGKAGPPAAFANYDLGDLLGVRRGGIAASRPPGGQLEQLTYYAAALRDNAADVLRGDHSVFPELAVVVERRAATFQAQRDRRA